MTENTEVLVPNTELTVHVKDGVAGFTVSKTIFPGSYILLSELADYQQRAARSGKIPGGKVMEQADADRMFELLQEAGEEETPLVIDLGAKIADD